MNKLSVEDIKMIQKCQEDEKNSIIFLSKLMNKGIHLHKEVYDNVNEQYVSPTNQCFIKIGKGMYTIEE
jgi:hypothetical protein